MTRRSDIIKILAKTPMRKTAQSRLASSTQDHGRSMTIFHFEMKS
jgi:hypothetical protein